MRSRVPTEVPPYFCTSRVMGAGSTFVGSTALARKLPQDLKCCIIAQAVGGGHHAAALWPGELDGDGEEVAQRLVELLVPFDGAHPGAVQVLAQRQAVDVAGRQPEQVDVVEWQAAARVGQQDRKRRTAYLFGADPEPLGQAAHEAGLSRPQLARQSDALPAAQAGS